MDINTLIQSQDLSEEEHLALVSSVIEKMQKEGKTLKEVLKLGAPLLEQIYSLAYAYYNQGKYKESLSLFEVLATTDPNTYKYVFGMAASYRELKEWDQAALGFLTAYHLSPNEPLAAFYLGDCLLQMEDKVWAGHFFTIAEKLASLTPGNERLKQRCSLILEGLKS